MNLFTAPETLPFGVAVALIVAVALLEGLGMLVALSPSNVIDDLLPHAVPESGMDRVLGWLHLGRVPALVLLLLFLLGYALFDIRDLLLKLVLLIFQPFDGHLARSYCIEARPQIARASCWRSERRIAARFS